jgi:hypothetical protein
MNEEQIQNTEERVVETPAEVSVETPIQEQEEAIVEAPLEN